MRTNRLEPMLDQGHSIDPNYVQRMTVQDWRRILLAYKDRIVYKGCVYKLVAKDIGYGVVEVRKDPEQLK